MPITANAGRFTNRVQLRNQRHHDDRGRPTDNGPEQESLHPRSVQRPHIQPRHGQGTGDKNDQREQERERSFFEHFEQREIKSSIKQDNEKGQRAEVWGERVDV